MKKINFLKKLHGNNMERVWQLLKEKIEYIGNHENSINLKQKWNNELVEVI